MLCPNRVHTAGEEKGTGEDSGRIGSRKDVIFDLLVQNHLRKTGNCQRRSDSAFWHFSRIFAISDFLRNCEIKGQMFGTLAKKM